MADPFIGEIRLFGFSRVPVNWAACDGSPLLISDNPTLYQLLGTTFGGDGVNSFNLPDLRGRVPLSQGAGGGLTPRAMGQIAGEENHTLLMAEMPSHAHSLVATTTAGTTATPDPTVMLAAASVNTAKVYAPPASVQTYDVMAPAVIPTGNSLAHNNVMPTLTCNYCICLFGIFPSQS
jgi:microcystin-dependent protein